MFNWLTARRIMYWTIMTIMFLLCIVLYNDIVTERENYEVLEENYLAQVDRTTSLLKQMKIDKDIIQSNEELIAVLDEELSFSADRIEELRDDNEALREELNFLTLDMEELRQELSRKRSQLDSKDERIRELESSN